MTPGLLARLSVRNLLAHRVKSLVVGLLIGMGTALVVVGSAVLGSVESAMRQSITSPLAAAWSSSRSTPARTARCGAS